jgi:hypothetical protein
MSGNCCLVFPSLSPLYIYLLHSCSRKQTSKERSCRLFCLVARDKMGGGEEFSLFIPLYFPAQFPWIDNIFVPQATAPVSLSGALSIYRPTLGFQPLPSFSLNIVHIFVNQKDCFCSSPQLPSLRTCPFLQDSDHCSNLFKTEEIQ